MSDASADRRPPGGRRRRHRWERRYEQKQGADFCWYLDESPRELVELVEAGGFPPGGALDLGCGPGVATAYLAQFFSPAVGLDIALGAVSQARHLSESKQVGSSFVVAEAPILPFRAGAFALIFDRGCLQAIPREAWPRYFQEADRLLRPEGMLQLFVSKPVGKFPPPLSYRGFRARARWLLGRRGPQFLSHAVLRGLLPPSMQAVTMKDFTFQPKTGPARLMTFGLFQKKREVSREGHAEIA